ncbi:MAG: hypothetical protein C4554_11045 [Dethiobacter sp.]|nr:MAG: hypothetical protein C4554_11045 [Dethiobacter sp.]
MRKVKEILRLRLEVGLSHHKIASSVSASSSTVSEVMVRAKNIGLDWPVLKEMDENKLHELLYPSVKRKRPEYGPEPDYRYTYHELRKKGVTLLLLWEVFPIKLYE